MSLRRTLKSNTHGSKLLIQYNFTKFDNLRNYKVQFQLFVPNAVLKLSKAKFSHKNALQGMSVMELIISKLLLVRRATRTYNIFCACFFFFIGHSDQQF